MAVAAFLLRTYWATRPCDLESQWCCWPDAFYKERKGLQASDELVSMHEAAAEPSPSQAETKKEVEKSSKKKERKV